jgi:hypothetical protein
LKFLSVSVWDTAGIQGQSDIIYDFTQLINGNLVCTGVNGNGVWAFVTDSTGKEIFWQGNRILPGVDANGGDLRILRPLSVCATPDTGFTIVGDNNTFGNNHNAFAMHWETPVAARRIPTARGNSLALQCGMHGGVVRLNVTVGKPTDVIVNIYTIQGKLLTRLEKKGMKHGDTILKWDASGVAKGVYLVRAEEGGKIVTERVER